MKHLVYQNTSIGIFMAKFQNDVYLKHVLILIVLTWHETLGLVYQNSFIDAKFAYIIWFVNFFLSMTVE